MHIVRKLAEYFLTGVIGMFALATAFVFFLVAFSYPYAVALLCLFLAIIVSVCVVVGWFVERFLTIG